MHYDTLLELPNRIGISLIGYLSSKLAHLLLNLITINEGHFTCSDLSGSFPDHSHGVGVRFIEPLTQCGAFLWCQLFDCFLDFSQISPPDTSNLVDPVTGLTIRELLLEAVRKKGPER